MNYRDFHAAGHKVFPLNGVDETGNCECGNPDCAMPYKHPRAAGWQNSPLWSDEQLDLMEETGQFATGYGVLCSGLVVLDVDARNGGIASLDKLLEQIPEIEDAGLIVATGSGGGSRHFYFTAPEGVAMVQHLKDYPGLDFKSSGFVVGPGSMHASGSRYTIIDGNIDDIDDTPTALVDLLRKPERHRAEYNGSPMDVSHADIADMLAHVDPDCDHETWVRCGMSCHDASQGTAFDVWHDWSEQGTKYPGRDVLEKRWHSFGKSANPVTIGTLIHYAEQGGWVQPVTFDDDTDWQSTGEQTVSLLDTSHVDLLRPPGFVGDVCAWINAQCRYPREHLAVAAALVSMGNICGLRYTDDLDGVTANLFAFGVAASGTGKEAVLQAAQKLLVEVGIAGASHGKQKSEQEIMRNLIRHQACFYLIDELGIEMKKVVNAQKKGNASYLEGMIGTLMSLYSKANGFALISGDVKEELRNSIIQEIAQHEKAIENNEDKSGLRQRRLDRLKYQRDNLDKGLDRPFLSLLGFTTPSTFDSIMDEDQATSGFMGRALLVREHDTNPRDKRPFKKAPLDDRMRLTLQSIYDGGEYDAQRDRVEYYGDRIEVQTTPEARTALLDALDWFLEYGDSQKEHSGLEAIPRRAYELISKVSLILAVPSGVRTLEHVRWAYALVRRDVDEKIRLVVANDKTHGADKQIYSAITKIISDDHGETLGVIRNKLRKRFKPEDVEAALEIMVGKGFATKEQKQHPKNKKIIERYFLAV